MTFLSFDGANLERFRGKCKAANAGHRWRGSSRRWLEREPLEEVGDEQKQLHLRQTLTETATATCKARTEKISESSGGRDQRKDKNYVYY